jgi:hypothetical protein
LGNGLSATNACTPIPLSHHKRGIYTLACGNYHTLGLTRSGDVCMYCFFTNFKVFAWGAVYNQNMGHLPSCTEPTLLLHGLGVTKIFADSQHAFSCALTANRDVWVWGRESCWYHSADPRVILNANVSFMNVNTFCGITEAVFVIESTKELIINRDSFTDLIILTSI